MTFLATFLALIPMAIGFGKGSEATVPLARAVVGGLLTSTFLTLVVVPILYTLLMKEGDVSGTDIEEELADRPEQRLTRSGLAEVETGLTEFAPPSELPRQTDHGGILSTPPDHPPRAGP
jgi:hypothetical protein